jgi:pimeloyl-ACP methyl ester carboxylesterase
MTDDPVPPPVTTRVEQDDGVRLHGLVWEPDEVLGCDVLLVHGLASNALLWSGVAARLRAAGHRVVAVDQRGHGRSDLSDDLGWARLTADLVGVAEALSMDRPLAVGQSWGGNVVVELARRHPQAVRAVVGIDGGAIELSASFSDWEGCWAALAPPRWDGVAWADVERSIRQRVEGWPSGSAEAFLANLARRPDGTATAILTRPRHEAIVRHLWEQRPSEGWSAIALPVLLLAALGGDEADETKRAALALAGERAPRLRYRLFDDADHDVHLQQPDDVTDALLGALTDGFLSPIGEVHT